ncbi:MAG: GAF domain-containing protein [Candidatus Kapaibacteriales bacterium]
MHQIQLDNLAASLTSLIDGEEDLLANMANFSAFIYHSFEDINWAGFYLIQPSELFDYKNERLKESNSSVLKLGPFLGKVACTEIAIGTGVCGTAAKTGMIQNIPDVEAFPGHIACDADSRSELVLPINLKGRTVAVFDIDSPILSRFDNDIETTISNLVTIFENWLKAWYK